MPPFDLSTAPRGAADESDVRPLVAFDESGNTGQNLTDPVQPVFALASVCLPADDARSLAEIATVPEQSEAKFSRLRGSNPDRKRLREFFRAGIITPATVKVGVYHKGFLITTKIVDMLIEEILHELGHNLYENRGAHAMANMLHSVMPAFFGNGAVRELHQCFVELARSPNPVTMAAFYAQVAVLRQHPRGYDLEAELGFLAMSEAIAPRVFSHPRGTEVDPAIPTFASRPRSGPMNCSAPTT